MDDTKGISGYFRKIFEAFDAEAGRIVEIINGEKDINLEFFSRLYVFDSINKRSDELKGKSGVYIFLISSTVSLSSKDIRRWNQIKGAGMKHYGAKDFAVGECLYVGSADSLYQRMTAHFSNGGACTGLKLANEKRRVLLKAVNVYAFTLKNEFNDYSKVVITQVESRLHALLSPYAGSSKV